MWKWCSTWSKALLFYFLLYYSVLFTDWTLAGCMYHRAVVVSHLITTIFQGMVSAKGRGVNLSQKKSHWERNACLLCYMKLLFHSRCKKKSHLQRDQRVYFPASREEAWLVLPQRQRLEPAALLEPLAQKNEHISLGSLLLRPCLLTGQWLVSAFNLYL